MDDKLAKVLNNLPAFRQRQDSTIDQLRDLERVAVKLGMYDAADTIRGMVTRHDEQVAKIDEQVAKIDEKVKK